MFNGTVIRADLNAQEELTRAVIPAPSSAGATASLAKTRPPASSSAPLRAPLQCLTRATRPSLL